MNKNPIGFIEGSAENGAILDILNAHGIHAFPKPHVDIWGSGQVDREFLFVYDLADASVFLYENFDLMENRSSQEHKKYFFNVGSRS